MRKIKPTVTEVTFTLNQEHSGCELRFPEPPGKAVTTLLAQNGWHFNKAGWKDPRWYTKHTPTSETFGKNLATVLNKRRMEEPAAIETAPEPEIAESAPVAEPTPKPLQPVTTGVVKAASSTGFW